MRDETWTRVQRWWADVFGVPESMVWQDGINLGFHAGAGDFTGIVVARRGTGVHVSLPEWATSKLADKLGRRDPHELLDRKFWLSYGPTDGRKVSSLVVHAYTDHQLEAPKRVGQIAPADVAEWEQIVSRKKWEASGFAGPVDRAFAVRSKDTIAAASNLTRFMGGSSSVGVLTHPAYRGKGFAVPVARAAASYAVRNEGLARYRYDADNARSRAVGAGLTFEDYCEQLTVW